MAGPSPIEWTDRTWNPVRGCTRISPGCGGPGPHGGCYAERVAARFSGPGLPYEGLAEVRGGRARWGGRLSFGHDLEAPLRWRTPCRIFVNSMSDLFHDAVPEEAIAAIFGAIALAPHQTFQVLTKRPSRMREVVSRLTAAECVAAFYLSRPEAAKFWPFDVARAEGVSRRGWPLPNVWLGTSTEDQRRADERVPDLLATPAAVRFVSAEPLLGRLDLRPWLHERWGIPGQCFDADGQPWHAPGSCRHCRPCLDLVIAGGESGPRARPMHVDWAREIRDACAAVRVPFFFKQWGEWAPEMLAARGCWAVDRWHEWPPEASHLALPAAAIRVGRAKAGRLLDGREHNGMPEVRHG